MFLQNLPFFPFLERFFVVVVVFFGGEGELGNFLQMNI